ncbi:hypothetical protein WA026_007928 [Henosepilachna vigintioctopunctata]|uniref:HTH psq-type domain-containing protein n=1 Tax=Henosepilachna vigintioctopunctata TaxID=420089 RepID=A0AAW1TNW3_9CUCU
MKTALDEVLSKEMVYRKAASEYGVPQTTLERYVKKMREEGEVTIGVSLGSKEPIFTTKEEDDCGISETYGRTSFWADNSRSETSSISTDCSLSSSERGQTITVEICFNAAGIYMPPLMIFPRQRMKPELLDHAPTGTEGVCNARSWITTEIFLTLFKKFIGFSGATPTYHVLLLLDGHISELFGNAYIQAATTSTEINAFRKCGIRPFNENNSTDADLISAATTDIQNIENSSSVEQQRVTEAEGPQHEVVPSVPSTTVVTTVSSTATTYHPEPVTTRPEVTTESCTPVRIDFITECTEQVTPDVTKKPAPEPEPGSTFASKSPIRVVCRDLISSLKMHPLVIFGPTN